MSLEMTVEADSRFKRADAIKLLMSVGATDIEENADSLTARFPESGMAVHFRDGLKNGNALTEGIEDRGWRIGSRMTFRYVTTNFAKCDADLRVFVRGMAETSKAFFVLAFQLEEIWAVSDENGLKFLR